ncbi:hypothetical protein D9615_001621 [Tricholomella constricta]|uniref:Uracil-DNA glycosylase-like domain-containing protein n=1 Tax=Tricholomella constricta TaxID=117010 RepID=A0A8H5HNQ3_9AGAR|nr:hypothetical protein D9615_001621 [Tricholomella constricta]
MPKDTSKLAQTTDTLSTTIKSSSLKSRVVTGASFKAQTKSKSSGSVASPLLPTTLLKKFLLDEHRQYTVYPPLHHVYTWSNLTPLDQVKVVVLGQDPYHNVGQAHGLSFSVLPPTKPPGSLKNIYKQLTLDYPTFKPPISGDLTPSAKSGVLWLNTSLTVRAHKAASHANKGWETFTAQVMRTVMERQGATHQGIVFMAWGLPAQKTCDKVGIDEEKHLVLKYD